MWSLLASPDKTRALAAPIPRICFCEEKTRLLREFLQAIHRLSDLQGQQTQAVIDAASGDDIDFTRFDALLYLAQNRKEQAKYAWIAHVEEHGCHEGSIPCDSHDSNAND